MTAIEQGIITPTTKSRLEELEEEQRSISSRLILENAEIYDVSKEKLLLWLTSFRHGDVENKAYQGELFENLLIAAYVYDDHLKIETNYTDQKTRIRMPYEFVDNIEKQSPEVFVLAPLGRAKQ
jgi:hypothetical protein